MPPEIISFFVGLVVGLGIGITIGTFLGYRSLKINLKSFAGYSVIIIWLAFLAMSLINPTIQIPIALHGIAGGIITALFGEEAMKKNKKD